MQRIEGWSVLVAVLAGCSREGGAVPASTQSGDTAVASLPSA